MEKKLTDCASLKAPAAVEMREIDGRPSLAFLNRNWSPYVIDFIQEMEQLQRQGRKAKTGPLQRAIGRAKGDLVFDATCGLGRDSCLLIYSGYRVCASEQNPWLAHLLADAHKKALADPRWGASFNERFEFFAGTAQAASFRPDVIYLDPMFQERDVAKKSALPRKQAQILRALMPGGGDGERELLKWALGAARRKVVVKGPLKAAPLLDGASASFSAKAVRYDVYARNAT